MAANIDPRERMRQLMMGRIDGELGADESRELDRLLEADEGARAEMQRLEKLQRITGAVSLTAPPDQVWEEYMNSVYRKVERGVGWILLSVGAIVLLSYGLWTSVKDLIASADVPLFMKGAILAVLIGIAIIAVSVTREKLFMHSKDPYREVKR